MRHILSRGLSIVVLAVPALWVGCSSESDGESEAINAPDGARDTGLDDTRESSTEIDADASLDSSTESSVDALSDGQKDALEDSLADTLHDVSGNFDSMPDSGPDGAPDAVGDSSYDVLDDTQSNSSYYDGSTPVPIVREVPGTMANVLAKASSDKSLTVGYLGGSITEGAGASNASKTSYRALTTAYLKSRLPGVTVTEINAGVGGTGSDLRAFRCNADLLSKNPDLVFVEFAVNDSGSTEDRREIAMEGITRQIFTKNPNASVVFLYTANKAIAASYYDKGLSYPTVTWHEKVGTYYAVPSINIGVALWQQIALGAGTWDTLTVDGTHPNDTGYAIYGSEIAKVLDKWIVNDTGKASTPKSLPSPFTKDTMEHGKLVDTWSISAPGWTQENKTLAGRYPHYISANAPGTELSYPFAGVAIGAYWLIAPDSGDLQWAIDGGAWNAASTWDKYALSYTRASYTLFSYTLAPGQHELKIKIVPTHNTQSTGTWIRIGAFLQGD